MRPLRLVAACLAVLCVSVPAVYGSPQPDAPHATVRDTVEELRRVYSTDMVLGTPLEVDGLKIIPLAAVGIGYGQKGSAERGTMQGAGGLVSPLGVIVVSPKGVQLLPVSKGVVEQLLGAITPVVLHVIRGERGRAPDETPGAEPGLSVPTILPQLYALLPEGGLKFGLFPWPLGLVLIFIAGWLVLALLIGVFLPQQVRAIAATLQAQTLRTGVIGLLSYGVVFILVGVFTVSIIGIPLTMVVLVLTWVLQLLGMVSIAALVGQRAASAMRYAAASPGVTILIGGVILGVVRIIPMLGWVVWLVLGLFGFGAVLLTHKRTVERQVLEPPGG
jgi:uncharacterized spore protein YtfJ